MITEVIDTSLRKKKANQICFDKLQLFCRLVTLLSTDSEQKYGQTLFSKWKRIQQGNW